MYAQKADSEGTMLEYEGVRDAKVMCGGGSRSLCVWMFLEERDWEML